jgi:hypothetical protein
VGDESVKQRHERHTVTERPQKNDAITDMTNCCGNVSDPKPPLTAKPTNKLNQHSIDEKEIPTQSVLSFSKITADW